MQLTAPADDRQQEPSAAEGQQTPPHTPPDAAGAVPLLACCGRAAILDGMLPKPVATRSDALSAAQQAALAEAINASAAPPMSWHLSTPSAAAPNGQASALGGSAMQTVPPPTAAQLAGAAAAVSAAAGGCDGPQPAPQPSSVSLILAAMLGLPAPAALDGSPLPLSWQPQQSGAATAAAVPRLQGFAQPVAAQQAIAAGASGGSLSGTGALLSQPAMQSTVQQPRSNGQEPFSSSGGPALHSQEPPAPQRQSLVQPTTQQPALAAALPQPDWQVLAFAAPCCSPHVRWHCARTSCKKSEHQTCASIIDLLIG